MLRKEIAQVLNMFYFFVIHFEFSIMYFFHIKVPFTDHMIGFDKKLFMKLFNS